VGRKSAPKKPVAKARGKGAAKAISPKSGADFTAVFVGLKEVRSAVEPALRAIADEPRKYHRVTKAEIGRAVLMFKGYVSYHLLPLYAGAGEDSLPRTEEAHAWGRRALTSGRAMRGNLRNEHP
jgi:hypothetical protein